MGALWKALYIEDGSTVEGAVIEDGIFVLLVISYHNVTTMIILLFKMIYFCKHFLNLGPIWLK
jgi:hypothetical protein